jgi:Helix-turn-helix domain
VAKEKLLVDAKSAHPRAKRVLASEKPDEFRAAFGREGQRVLRLLASGPKYPAEVARALGAHHQTVYYCINRLERSGLIVRAGREKIRGGLASRFALASDGYAVEYAVKGDDIPSLRAAGRSGSLGRFFREFVPEGSFGGWVVVGSPMPHGPRDVQARDGHYAVQLGFALGQWVSLPAVFPVKLDVDVKSEKAERSNMIVVGGPRTNVVAEELNRHMPVKFREGGFWGSIVDQDGKAYSSDLDCVVAKIRNPWDESKVCVVAAGLTGAATKAAIVGITTEADAVLKRYREGPFACVLRGVDRDGDGKVDGVEVLNQRAV